MHLDQGEGQRELALQAQPARARGLAGDVVGHAGVRLAQQRDHAVQQHVCVAPLCVPHLQRTTACLSTGLSIYSSSDTPICLKGLQ